MTDLTLGGYRLAETAMLAEASRMREFNAVVTGLLRDAKAAQRTLGSTLSAVAEHSGVREFNAVVTGLLRDAKAAQRTLGSTLSAVAEHSGVREFNAVVTGLLRDAKAAQRTLGASIPATGIAAVQNALGNSVVRPSRLDEPVSMPTQVHDTELAPTEADISDAAGSLVVLYVLTGMLLAAVLANPGEFTTQIRFWLALSDVPTTRYPEIRGLMNWLAVYGLLMTFRPRR